MTSQTPLDFSPRWEFRRLPVTATSVDNTGCVCWSSSRPPGSEFWALSHMTIRSVT